MKMSKTRCDYLSFLCFFVFELCASVLVGFWSLNV